MARTPHMRHVRHRSFDRLRHSRRFRQFLEEQGERLFMSPEDVFNDLMKAQGLTAEQVAAREPEIGPGNTVAPVISGSTVVGQVLTTSDGTWTGSPAPTFTYQWRRGGVDIAGATAKTYTLVVADEGALMTAVVTATNIVEAVNYETAAVGPVTAAP